VGGIEVSVEHLSAGLASKRPFSKR
jgi:hypothetical protein